MPNQTPPDTRSPKKCEDLPPSPLTPKIPDPPPCQERCSCPPEAGTDTNCFSVLIDKQTRELAAAERTKQFKADLEDLLKKTKAAKDEYTADKRRKLVDAWKRADTEISELIQKLVCAVHCWECLIECRICKRLNEIRRMELELNGNGQLTEQVFSLYDKQYWLARNRDLRREVFERIRAVFTVWEKPAQTIEKALADNTNLLDSTRKIIATDTATAVYDMFMRIVPLHIAIKPPGEATSIKEQYRKLCECYPGSPDACCGPDVGEMSLRQRLIGPQPYLIEADKLEEMFCCLALERYLPAKEALGAAEAELAAIDALIKRRKTEIEERKKSLPADFKAGLATPIDCDQYKPKENNGGGEQPKPCGPQATTQS